MRLTVNDCGAAACFSVAIEAYKATEIEELRMRVCLARSKSVICTVVMLLSGVACSSASSSNCAASVVLTPTVEQVYPISGRRGVPTNVGYLVLAGSGVAPITLLGPAGSLAAPPRALPKPLPSPMSTPLAGQQLFAVSIPTLVPAKKYGSIATVTEHYACGPSATARVQVGTFVTK
jgi:hypothetical protein